MASNLAVNTDGELTYCTADEDHLGKGRCNHIVHQKYESAEVFTKTVENNIEAIKEIAERKDRYDLIDSYVIPINAAEWLKCPTCGLRPKVWIFNNGNTAACGCGTNRYHHFSVKATPVGQVLLETGGFNKYDDNELLNNWNDHCKTGNLEHT